MNRDDRYLTITILLKVPAEKRMRLRVTGYCPFDIMNTDRSDKNGTHWWSFLDLHRKKEVFLFDSFGFKGFKEFIIQDDKKIINKIFYDVEKFDKKHNNQKQKQIILEHFVIFNP